LQAKEYKGGITMKKNTRKLYAAYGSNLNLPQMERRCPDARIVRATELKDYELLFRTTGRSSSGGAVATVEPKKGCNVPILIWEVSAKDEINLDAYEGYPYLYRKEYIDIDGEKVMIYIMNYGNLGAPSEYYYNVIAAGYETAGWDISPLVEGVKKSTTQKRNGVKCKYVTLDEYSNFIRRAK
jgi:hypothetical protein